MMLNCTPRISAAQNISGSSADDSSFVFMQDAKHFAEVGFGLLASPFMFNGQDWARVGLTVSGTGLLFTTDKSVKDFALRNQNKLNDHIFKVDSYHGNYYSLFLACGIYGYGALAGNNKIRKTGLHAAEAFIYSGAITSVFKYIIGRRRPYAGGGHLFLRSFQFSSNDYHSLPSGHTTVSFAVSTVLAKSVNNIYWKVFWYGSAGLVGASRIYHNKHWLADVFLGAVIGYTVGDYVTGFDGNEQPRLFGKHIQPYLGYNTVGLRVYMR